MSSCICVLMPPYETPPTELQWGLTYVVPCMCHHANSVDCPQMGAWGEVEKPRQDMVFLMIVPSTNARGDQVFSLAVVWAHPHQGCLFTVVEAAWKLMLLVDDSPDWPDTFIHMNDTMLHALLSDNRHIGAMTDGICSVNACGELHQVQVWKLLQHDDSIVFPEGLNREPKSLQFSFWELPLWNATSADGPIQDLPMIGVVLSSAESETARPTQVPPTLLAIKPPCDITTVLNLHFQGALEWLHQISHAASAPTSQHSMPGRQPSSLALGAPPSTRTEGPLGLEGMDSPIPDPMATSSQASQGEVMPEHAPNIVQVSHSPSLPTILKNSRCGQHLPSPQSQAPQAQSNWPAWWGALTARGDECSPGVAAHNQGQPELPPKRAGMECQHCHPPKWNPGYWGHQRGRSLMCAHH